MHDAAIFAHAADTRSEQHDTMNRLCRSFRSPARG
jgi:hypothetical protein